MILHRLRLNNFRGVADRELTFPDRGVVVVCGPNEIGKSSMLEALDLLLGYKDRSTHRDVKQVKPTHADVGAQVEAEISTGHYRFVYRKRFHKKQMTELEVIAPKREQFTGDEAHERVEAILRETLDTKLWDAQRVLQSASTEAVNLSGSDALSRALDAAAGAAATTAPGVDALLIDRIDTEFLRYFTATGRPTKEWKAAIDRLRAAEAEVRRCTERVAEVGERVRRHEELSVILQTLGEALAPAGERLAAARRAHSVVAELAEQWGQARLVAAAAEATSANSALANGQRQQLIAECDRRAAILVGLGTEAAAADQAEAQARDVADSATRAAEQTATALAAAQQRLEAARVTAQACVALEEADRLDTRVQRIEQTESNLAQVAGQLAAIALTDAVLAEIDAESALVERLQAQLDAEAGTVQFTVATDLDITVDGQSRTLPAGHEWSQPASSAIVVDVPGVMTVRVSPGASAVKLQTDRQAAQQRLDQALARGGVADVEAARAVDQQRRALATTSAELTAALAVLRDGVDVDDLRARLAELRDGLAGHPELDPERAAAELATAAAGQEEARVAAETQQAAAAAATVALSETSTLATVLRDRMTTADAELTAVRDQLAMLRAAVSDEAVAAQAAADLAAKDDADATVTALAQRHAAADPVAVDAEMAAAAAAAEAIAADRDAVTLEMHNLTVELGVMGSEGRQGDLDSAEAHLEYARIEHARLEERAAAAEMLRETMLRHRDNTRQRYVQPYRSELERLGRIVFGESFEVDVDAELTICARSLDGRTVPFGSLSGGAREQLGILARLAGAALVAEEDTVPVVIDDALGFSDPDRLDKMGEVFDTVGQRGQVIVLTCTPGRYDGIADAEVIELSA